MNDLIERLALPRKKARVSLLSVRVDIGRDTEMLVQRNLAGHPHIRIGSHPAEITIIAHPHAVRRLRAALDAIEAGEELHRG